tara:strand:+ start:877 stop:1536 length:660 start_codon:yes stop_codon:yes gene_type:complete
MKMTDDTSIEEFVEVMLKTSQDLVNKIKYMKKNIKKDKRLYNKLHTKHNKQTEKLKKSHHDNVILKEKIKKLYLYKKETSQFVSSLHQVIDEQEDVIIDMTMQNAELQSETEAQKKTITEFQSNDFKTMETNVNNLREDYENLHIEQNLHQLTKQLNTLFQKEDTFKEEGLCIVCRTQPSDTVFFNCLHLCVCSHCATNLTACPYCRGNIRSRKRIYTV